MIDITPLDVRSKRGDFKKGLRGYDPQEVDVFLELVADRLEDVVRQNVHLRDRVTTLEHLVESQTGREKAVHEALVTAQELRADIKGTAQREADLIVAEARTEARRLGAEAEAEVRGRMREAERHLEQARDALEEMERHRIRFLKSFRQLLERELEDLEVEERKAPLEERPIDLEFGRARARDPEARGGSAQVHVEPLELQSLAEDPLATLHDADIGPTLDASVDDLAAGYRGEVEKLFEERFGRDDGEADLFSRPNDTDEDTRWG